MKKTLIAVLVLAVVIQAQTQTDLILEELLKELQAQNQVVESNLLSTYNLGGAITYSLGGMNKFPLTATQALSKGWAPAKSVLGAAKACIPGLGVFFAPKSGLSSSSPLGAFYTPDGKIAGLRMNIYGKQSKTFWSKGVSSAAPGKLVQKGFWRQDKASGGHYITVSFRSVEDVCASSGGRGMAIGDRLVINQMKGGIAKSVPMTAAEAKANNFQAGSCMGKMGQHWFYDLQSAPKMSWKAENLLPIVPMYHLMGPNTGKLNAFFFTSPVCQNKQSGDWDIVPVICGLTADFMCANWCNSKCKWDTSWWATEHIFFNANPDSVKCASTVSFWEN